MLFAQFLAQTPGVNTSVQNTLGPIADRATLVIVGIATAFLVCKVAFHGVQWQAGGEGVSKAKKGLTHTAVGYALVLGAATVVGILHLVLGF